MLNDSQIVEATWYLYDQFCDKFGNPARPLKQVLVGNLQNEDEWANCTQLLGGSHVCYDNTLLAETDKFIIEIVCHELAHVWAGVENDHGKIFKEFEKKFKNCVDKVMTGV